MKLLTEEIKAKLPKLRSMDGKDPATVPIIVKFFTPDSNWSWFATEGEEVEGGDWEFFGMVHGFERELGYFRLSELEQATGPMGLHIERDMYYDDHKLSEVL
jgi:hypothetical protein